MMIVDSELLKKDILKIWIKHRRGFDSGTHLPVNNYHAFTEDLITLFNSKFEIKGKCPSCNSEDILKYYKSK